jgi:hypothetical protein
MEIGGFRYLPVNAEINDGGAFNMQDVVERMAERLRRYDEALALEDPLGVAVRGLIYIDESFRHLLKTAMAKPEALNLDRANGARLVTLAEALGLIDADFAKTIRAFVKVRNAFAHEIERDLTDDDVDSILQTINRIELADAYKVELGNHADQDHTLARLRVIIRVLNEQLLILWHQTLVEDPIWPKKRAKSKKRAASRNSLR